MRRVTVAPSEGDVARAKIEYTKTAHEYDMSKPAILKYAGTMLPLIAARWELWFYFLVHSGLVILFRLAKYDMFGLSEIALEPDYEAPWNIIKVPTALLTFFLVFFNGKCYDRFCGYYNAHCGIGGRLQQLAGQTLSSWPNHPAERWEAMRYLIASACVVYFKASDPPGAPRPRPTCPTATHIYGTPTHELGVLYFTSPPMTHERSTSTSRKPFTMHTHT